MARSRLTRWVGPLVFLLLLSRPPGVAASCPPISPSEQEAQADAIVEGTVVSLVPVGPRSEVTIRVERVIKGSPPSPVVLQTSPPGQGIAGEVPFNEGWKHWRLYLREIEPGSGRYFTMLCFGTTELPAPPTTLPQAGSRSVQTQPAEGCGLHRPS